jgi:hypothetical protein
LNVDDGINCVIRTAIVELEVPALVQGHQRDRGDRLGHGVDAKDRVVPHRRVALAIHAPERLEVGEVPAARDCDLAAGELARVDVTALEVFGDARETRG